MNLSFKKKKNTIIIMFKYLIQLYSFFLVMVHANYAPANIMNKYGKFFTRNVIPNPEYNEHIAE